MANNLLEDLQQSKVPPPPQRLQQAVHNRLNQWLLTAQTAELVLHGFAYAIVQFSAAVIGLLNYTLSGGYEIAPSREDEDNEASQE